MIMGEICKHKAVILDGYALNPGDISWDGFRALVPDLTIHDRTSPEDVVARCKGADIVIVNKTVISAETIAALPRLRYIGVLATGYNVIDVSAAAARNIAVCNVPAYGTSSVAQHVFALLLSATNEVSLHADSVRRGCWTTCKDFCYWESQLTELEGLSIGIVGYGRIGQRVAQIARAFGMKVLVAAHHPGKSDAETEFVALDELFSRADVITLHCPLTPETNLMVNAERLNLVKPSAILINTGRGGLIDEKALADALAKGALRCAALDVLSTEPPRSDNPLLSLANCKITPHIAWATDAARRRLMEIAVDNLAAYLRGEPQNLAR